MTEMVSWVRKTIEADLAAAKIIGAGGFEPQRWDTEPPGQVNPEAASVTDAINEALLPDPEDRPPFRPYLPRWVQIVSYDRLNNEPPEADCRDDDMPVILVQDGRRQFDHIVRHDPRNVVADCEAKLAILDAHHILSNADRSEAYEEFSVVAIGGANKDHGCVTCHYYGMGGVKGHGVCYTVRTLVAGYKHRDGFDPSWLTSPR